MHVKISFFVSYRMSDRTIRCGLDGCSKKFRTGHDLLKHQTHSSKHGGSLTVRARQRTQRVSKTPSDELYEYYENQVLPSKLDLKQSKVLVKKRIEHLLRSIPDDVYRGPSP